MPYAVLTIYDFADELDRSVYIYSMLIMILNSSLNPIFYGLTNPQFQKGYKKLFYIMGFSNYSDTIPAYTRSKNSTVNSKRPTTNKF